ncbi:hypothetical protein Avbf_13644 [Armadillidium vulgare]|nr:hypothetical protein Avbf_13644 [Armadillidium vulgare]
MDYIIAQEIGSVLWPENISDVTENTSIVARQPVLWPVNVSIPTGGYQHCVIYGKIEALNMNPAFGVEHSQLYY